MKTNELFDFENWNVIHEDEHIKVRSVIPIEGMQNDEGAGGTLNKILSDISKAVCIAKKQPKKRMQKNKPKKTTEEKMIKVKSSCMAAYKYNEGEATLDVQFTTSGATYRYYDVPNSVSHKLKDMILKTESLGTYFNGNVRNRYHCEKLN